MHIITIAVCFIDPMKLILLEVIGQGSFETVHLAAWQGILIAAKIIPMQFSEAASEVNILKFVVDGTWEQCYFIFCV